MRLKQPYPICATLCLFTNSNRNFSTNRYITGTITRGTDCNVFEFKKWEWGGVFGFINGVNILDIKDFQSRLEREVGKVNLRE